MTKIFMSLVDLYQFLPARWGGNPEWAGSWAGQQIFRDLCSSLSLDPAGLRDSRPIGTSVRLGLCHSPPRMEI